MIVIEKDKYYIGFWYVEWDDGNWMGCAWTETDSDHTHWMGRFRFREYRDGKVLFNSKDVKHWYGTEVWGASEIEVLAHYRDAANLVAEHFNADINEFVGIHGGPDVFQEIDWGQYPWWNQRTEYRQEHGDTPRQGGNND